ncbi:unnamed protein product [Prorocentrum cordatum]|uniref:Calmodulin n=1 Tax=Prorocentrum cordatum TaxID=2364126 RepID=A0ABN9R878_9DINO|nr:unnamed protein product [Polarella glacialis]
MAFLQASPQCFRLYRGNAANGVDIQLLQNTVTLEIVELPHEKVGHRFIGKCNRVIRVIDSRVQLDDIFEAFQSDQVHHEIRAEPQFIRLSDLQGIDIVDFVTHLHNAGCQEHSELLKSIAAQVLREMSGIVESMICAAHPVRGNALEPMDLDGGAGGGRMKLYHARNARLTERLLCQYVDASRRAFKDPRRRGISKEDARCVSIAGPDGTKVGTDLSITMGVVMDQRSGVCAVAPPQVPTECLTEQCFCDSVELAELEEKHRLHFRSVVKRKVGEVQVDEKGEPTGDPFDWRLLCISPDMGPDMVATDAFLSYEKNINLQCDYDQSHTLNNASKGALREGVWKHMDSCGSCDQDDLFLFYLPHIRRQMKEVDLSTHEVVEAFWKSLRNHSLLHTKSERVHLGKFQAPIVIAGKTIHLFSLKAYFLNAAVMTLGFKGTDRRTTAPPKEMLPYPDPAEGAVVECVPNTLKAQSHKSFDAKCANQLDRAAFLFGDISNFNRQRRIVDVLSLVATFHGKRPWVYLTALAPAKAGVMAARQNKELRSADATKPYELKMCKGFYHRAEQLTMTNANFIRHYSEEGIFPTWVDQRICLNDPRVQMEDENCQMLHRLIVDLPMQQATRNLVWSHGLPRRQVLLLDQDEAVQQAFLDELRHDRFLYMELQKATFEGSDQMRQGHVMRKMCNQQLLRCLGVEDWKVTPRLAGHLETKIRRHIASQIIEDCFGKAKAKIDKQSNTLSCPKLAMAAVIDSEVVRVTHKFEEVDPQQVQPARAAMFAPTTFKPQLQRRFLDKKTEDLGLYKISGYGDAFWWSPQACGHAQALSDLEVLRQAHARGKMADVPAKFYSQLVQPNILVRKVDDAEWRLGLGCVDGCLVVTWPVVSTAEGSYKVNNYGHRDLRVIFDPSEWEGLSVKYASPLHQAILQTMSDLDNATAATEVDLKLLEGTFCDFREVAYPSASLATLIKTLCRAVVPDCTDLIINQAFFARTGSFHMDDSIEDPLHLEWVTDVFDKGLADEVLQECKAAKAIKSQRTEFTDEVCKWKLQCQDLLLVQMIALHQHLIQMVTHRHCRQLLQMATQHLIQMAPICVEDSPPPPVPAASASVMGAPAAVAPFAELAAVASVASTPRRNLIRLRSSARLAAYDPSGIVREGELPSPFGDQQFNAQSQVLRDVAAEAGADTQVKSRFDRAMGDLNTVMGQQLEMHTKCLGWLEEYQLLAHKHESHAEQLLVDLDQEKVKGLEFKPTRLPSASGARAGARWERDSGRDISGHVIAPCISPLLAGDSERRKVRVCAAWDFGQTVALAPAEGLDVSDVQVGYADPPNGAPMKWWVAAVLWGDDVPRGKVCDVAGWWAVDFFTNHICDSFPAVTDAPEKFRAGGTQYDLVVVEGMSRLSTPERVELICEVGRLAVWTISTWAQQEIASRKLTVHPAAIPNLLAHTNRWVSDGIRVMIDTEAQAAIETHSAPPSRKLKTARSRQAAARRSASSGGLSYLDSVAVRPVQVEDYHRRIEEFYGFVRRQGLSTCTLDSPEAALLDWAGDALLEGRKKHDGEKLKAAVLHYYPNLQRPNTKPLARFERCLKARGRRRPALGRLPPPCPTICGLAVGLHLLSHTDMAVAVLVALSAYLRPGELRGLRVRDYGAEHQKWSLIFGPSDGQGDPTKTGVCDDNVTMDHENPQFLGHFFELHRRGKAPDEPLCSFAQAELGAMIAKALKVCNLEGLGIVPHSLRHAGPSWDVITGRRSQLGVGKAVARCGISSLEVEIQSSLDLLAPGVMEALLKLVSSGRVKVICQHRWRRRCEYEEYSEVSEEEEWSWQKKRRTRWVRRKVAPARKSAASTVPAWRMQQARGKVLDLPVSQVRFTQASIKHEFSDGRKLDDLIADLESGKVNPKTHKNLLLRGFQQDARGPHHPATYFCENNRRLHCLSEFQRRHPEREVKVRMFVDCFMGKAKKAIQALTTVNGGTTVTVRRPASARSSRDKAMDDL